MSNEIAVNTLAFNGYSRRTALQEIARLGVNFIEPVFISKYDAGLKEDYFTEANARKLFTQISSSGLKVRSVASHMDMGLIDTADVFQKRMVFAKRLGAAIIITNTSKVANERQFYLNMEMLAGIADDLGLMIALENPGDGYGYIMNNATDGAEVIERLGSTWIGLNFDFSNIHTLTKGQTTYDAELQRALPYIAHLHLKNIREQNNSWRVCSLKEGVIDYKKLFFELSGLLDIPASIELPLRYGYDKDFEFVPHDEGKSSLKKIYETLDDSITYLDQILTAKKNINRLI